jgi:hypothetical protein
MSFFYTAVNPAENIDLEKLLH